MSMIENLEYIKKDGTGKFLEKEAAKWKCPDCGEVVCCYNELCCNCSLDKLRQKKHQSSLEEKG